ncbi:MAG: thermonuclease family protein [Aquamicrobium sp.]|nr:thermonuclease family protein [Aquamicrobium sp.]
MIGRGFASLFIFLILTVAVSGAELVAGPVEARVLRVIDGDTFEAEALVWPGHRVRVAVRIRGVDAPELRSRCVAERHAGLHAKDALERLIGGRIVTISQVGGGKYYGRVLADATNAEGLPIADALLKQGVVRPYSGGRRVPFCDNLAQAGAS